MPAKKVVKATAKSSKPIKKAELKVQPEVKKETGLKQSVFSVTGKVLENITLPKEIFDLPENKQLLSQAVRVYLANQRTGTAKTKSRGEVKISTRKLYRQKGTGRARHGAGSAPIFVGGGVAFGPKPRDYSLKLSQKLKKLALFTALSLKLKNGEIKLVSGLEKVEPKTKNMAQVIAKLGSEGKKNLLLVTPEANEKYSNVVRSARNIKGVEILPSNLLNTYAVMRAGELLLMKDAIEKMKEAAK